MAGKKLPPIGFTKGFAGCQTGYDYFLKNKWITDKPVAGDIGLFDWNGDKRYDHTVIFVRHLSSINGKPAQFESIEGNTSIGNDSNGGEVMLRKRNYSTAIFVHPKV